MNIDTITHADAIEFMRELPDQSVDMVLTSPPYDGLRAYNGYSFDFESTVPELLRVVKTGGVVVWVVGDSVVDGSESLTSFRQALYFRECGFRAHDTMIYYRPGVVFPDPSRYSQCFEYMFVFSKDAPRTRNLLTRTSRYAGQRKVGSYRDDGSDLVVKSERVVHNEAVLENVWRIDAGYMKTTPDVEAYTHPAMFPEELARRHILTWTNPDELILDCFMGSGTTAKVARKYGRHFIGCDVSAEYVALANKRLADTDPLQPKEVAPGLVQHSLFGQS